MKTLLTLPCLIFTLNDSWDVVQAVSGFSIASSNGLRIYIVSSKWITTNLLFEDLGAVCGFEFNNKVVHRV